MTINCEGMEISAAQALLQRCGISCSVAQTKGYKPVAKLSGGVYQTRVVRQKLCGNAVQLITAEFLCIDRKSVV